MQRPPLFTAVLVAALCLLTPSLAVAAGGPSGIGNFGPTGLEVELTEDHTLKVLKVQAGSPAEGKIEQGHFITRINGQPPALDEYDDARVFAARNYLADFITEAEATDGELRMVVRTGPEKKPYNVTLTIPVLGKYSDTWPIDCTKTDKIIRMNADYLHSIAGGDGENLINHNMYDAWAILSLLATGEEQDLGLVRKVYASRMAGFSKDQVGSHNWHNGMQGIAVCEYYLRTGDKSVMPLINEVCEKIRKYQVQGGWSHWAKGINPQYVAGGHLNAAGTQNLTTLLLAEMCGADVDKQALLDALPLFLRYVGHGLTPYGNHRPEDGYGSNNAKTEMVGMAMGVAARSTDGEVYAMARDKSTSMSVYDYPHILRGHTGGYGTTWYGVASIWMTEKKPELYYNRFKQLKWHYELSRRFDGAMGLSGSGRYDQLKYGRSLILGLSAPRKTLQITGAPTSPYAREFSLPRQPWGRPSDTAFYTLTGGPGYKGTDLLPHAEFNAIPDMNEDGLRSMASHPEQAYRMRAAHAIRDQQMYRLIEELLFSGDPLAQQTACRAINMLESWGLRFAKDWRGRHSLDAHEFTPRMFEGLMRIIKDARSPLWSVDQALIACAAATTDQIKSELDTILPFLQYDEVYLKESATIALAPAMSDEAAFARVLPLVNMTIATNMNAKTRGVMNWAMKQAVQRASPAIQQMALEARVHKYKMTPHIPNREEGVDIRGITSCALEAGIRGIAYKDGWGEPNRPDMILLAADLAAERIDQFRNRELNRVIDILLNAGESLEGEDRVKMGVIMSRHFRPAVVGEGGDALMQAFEARDRGAMNKLNKLLAIDDMSGIPGGWEMFGRDSEGNAQWWFTSFEPSSKLPPDVRNRWREVTIPDRLKGWYKPGYNPKANGWERVEDSVFGVAPRGYTVSGDWMKDRLETSGEAVFVRKKFEIEDLNYKLFRLNTYSRQGFDVYLNGHKVASRTNRSRTWQASTVYLGDQQIAHLKPGENVIAVRSFLQYFRGPTGGGVDVFLEGLREFPSVE